MKIIPIPGQDTLKACAKGSNEDIGYGPATLPAFTLSPDMTRPSPGSRFRIAFLPTLLKANRNSQKKLPEGG